MRETRLTPKEWGRVEGHIRRLEAANKGRLTAEMLVRDAQSRRSPLHRCFEWDVRKAAWQHWLDQARELIRRVVVEYKTETMTIKAVAYVRDPGVRREDQGYIAVERLRDDADAAREALKYEFARASGALHRAQSLAHVLGMRAEISDIRSRVEKVRKKVDTKKAERKKRAA